MPIHTYLVPEDSKFSLAVVFPPEYREIEKLPLQSQYQLAHHTEVGMEYEIVWWQAKWQYAQWGPVLC